MLFCTFKDGKAENRPGNGEHKDKKRRSKADVKRL